MTKQQHPITPPSELWYQWLEQWNNMSVPRPVCLEWLATRAARWGADQELEACAKWLDRNNQWAKVDIDELRDARRPKPPSLKEQALGLLNEGPVSDLLDHEVDTIRRALEALPND
jgi:hypothetical protein